MRSIVTWIVAGVALVLCPGGAAPLAAQCMACVSSSACAESAKRGDCVAQCFGTACACSDSECKAGVTVAPFSTDAFTGLAVGDVAGQTQVGTVGVLVRECDGTLEYLVYSADGTRLIESWLLGLAAGEPAVVRAAHSESSSGRVAGLKPSAGS